MSPRSIDAQLRQAARAGDAAAFERLVAPYRADLHRFCTLMVGCPVQGINLVCVVLEDARAALLAGDIAELEACSSTRAWLHRLAARVCLQHLDVAE